MFGQLIGEAAVAGKRRATESDLAVAAGRDERRAPAEKGRTTAPHVRIQASSGWRWLDLEELWAHRDLVYFLTWRDIKVRYKQTLLGAAWAILQPVLTMALFAVVFGRLAKVPSDGVPYAVFAYVGLVPWSFVATGVTQSANSLVQNASLLTKVYFPRLAIPIASVIGGVVDFVLAFIVLLLLLAWFGIPLTARALVAPLFALLALVVALGVGFWLSAINVRFRDVRHAMPFLVQFWMFATPIAYPSSLFPEPWRTLSGLNPLAGVVDGLRWALLGVNTLSASMLAVAAAVALLLLATGAIYFRSMERRFADIV